MSYPSSYSYPCTVLLRTYPSTDPYYSYPGAVQNELAPGPVVVRSVRRMASLDTASVTSIWIHWRMWGQLATTCQGAPQNHIKKSGFAQQQTLCHATISSIVCSRRWVSATQTTNLAWNLPVDDAKQTQTPPIGSDLDGLGAQNQV